MLPHRALVDRGPLTLVSGDQSSVDLSVGSALPRLPAWRRRPSTPARESTSLWPPQRECFPAPLQPPFGFARKGRCTLQPAEELRAGPQSFPAPPPPPRAAVAGFLSVWVVRAGSRHQNVFAQPRWLVL